VLEEININNYRVTPFYRSLVQVTKKPRGLIIFGRRKVITVTLRPLKIGVSDA
jgi:hypothetical protein